MLKQIMHHIHELLIWIPNGNLMIICLRKLINNFGPFSIDLFASRLNKKYKRFCSRFLNPDVTTVDALTISWVDEKFYAFLLFALIPKTLRKIISDRAEGVVVVLRWPTQPWYPLFISLLAPPLIISPDENLLLSPCRAIKHPLAAKLSLMVGKLSGRYI